LRGIPVKRILVKSNGNRQGKASEQLKQPRSEFYPGFTLAGSSITVEREDARTQRDPNAKGPERKGTRTQRDPNAKGPERKGTGAMAPNARPPGADECCNVGSL
jgi:hypothetical protein